jgi:hypothetical protein
MLDQQQSLAHPAAIKTIALRMTSELPRMIRLRVNMGFILSAIGRRIARGPISPITGNSLDS